MLDKTHYSVLVMIWKLPREKRQKSTIVSEVVKANIVKRARSVYPILNDLLSSNSIQVSKETGRIWLTTEGELMALLNRTAEANLEKNKEKNDQKEEFS